MSRQGQARGQGIQRFTSGARENASASNGAAPGQHIVSQACGIAIRGPQQNRQDTQEHLPPQQARDPCCWTTAPLMAQTHGAAGCPSCKPAGWRAKRSQARRRCTCSHPAGQPWAAQPAECARPCMRTHLCLTRLRLRLPEKAPMFIVDLRLPTEVPMAIGTLEAAAPAEGIASAPLEAAGREEQKVRWRQPRGQFPAVGTGRGCPTAHAPWHPHHQVAASQHPHTQAEPRQ